MDISQIAGGLFQTGKVSASSSNLLARTDTDQNNKLGSANAIFGPSLVTDLSSAAKAFEKLNSLDEQLDKILGPPKQLSPAEIKSVDKINKQLDELLSRDTLSAEDEKKVGKLFDKLDSIFGEPKLTAEQEKKVDDLIQQIESLEKSLGLSEEEDGFELSEADDKRLTALEEELDKLTTPNLTKAQQKEAARIYADLEKLFSGEGSKGNVEKKASALFEELDKVIGPDKPLSDTQQQRVDAINKEINQIFEKHEFPVGL